MTSIYCDLLSYNVVFEKQSCHQPCVLHNISLPNVIVVASGVVTTGVVVGTVVTAGVVVVAAGVVRAGVVVTAIKQQWSIQ
jgi:hypothetical protein